MDDQILEQNDKTAFRGADRKEQVNHPDNCPIAAQNENAAAVWLFKNEAQTAELLSLIRAKIAFFTEQLAEKARKFVKVFRDCRFDGHVAHRKWLFHRCSRVAIPVVVQSGSTFRSGGLDEKLDLFWTNPSAGQIMA
jgi:hypothetical protein